jgi:thioredoxin reductase (NADPH)
VTALSSYQVIVIGAGPVGLFSVFMCGMMGLSCAVVDALPHIGGQCSALYPEKPIFDIPGLPCVNAQDLIQNLSQQIQPFQPRFFLNQSALELKPFLTDEKEPCDVETLKIFAQDPKRKLGQELQWQLTTNQNTLQAPVILIASGIGSFQPKRPALDSLESFENKSVFYHVQHQETFRHKHVVIAGGGDSAVDWANILSDMAASVTMVHRRDTFRALPESVTRLTQQITQGKIKLKTPFQLEGLNASHDPGFLTSLRIRSLDGSQQETIPADYLLAFFGVETDTRALTRWGLNIQDQKIIINPATGSTNLPGIYAAGDSATYPRKLKLILSGFAESAQGAYHIREYLFPEKNFRFQYSTTTGVPQNT